MKYTGTRLRESCLCNCTQHEGSHICALYNDDPYQIMPRGYSVRDGIKLKGLYALITRFLP